MKAAIDQSRGTRRSSATTPRTGRARVQARPRAATRTGSRNVTEVGRSTATASRQAERPTMRWRGSAVWRGRCLASAQAHGDLRAVPGQDQTVGRNGLAGDSIHVVSVSRAMRRPITILRSRSSRSALGPRPWPWRQMKVDIFPAAGRPGDLRGTGRTGGMGPVADGRVPDVLLRVPLPLHHRHRARSSPRTSRA